MLEKSQNAAFFQWFVCRVTRKVGLLKRRVRSHVVSREIKNCTSLWRKAHFEVKMHKAWGVRITFWSYDVEKLHAAVARSAFGGENVQNTSWLEHFWKFWSAKIARRCGEKRIMKSKCWKTEGPRALLEVLMRKNCTPLWRKAHYGVKMLKNWWSGSTFGSSDAQKLHAPVARRTRQQRTVFEVLMSKN